MSVEGWSLLILGLPAVRGCTTKSVTHDQCHAGPPVTVLSWLRSVAALPI